MKELDLLLQGYIQHYYEEVSPEDRREFVLLLELPDDELWRYFYGNSVPTDPSLAELVRKILSTGPFYD
jgi:antitoxin CptB